MSLAQPPRNVRNNNPGNIVRTDIPWQGLCPPEDMTPAQRAEDKFCVFVTAEKGFRALALDLLTSWKAGRRDVSALISRFAPPNENVTGAYVKAVANDCGVNSDTQLDLTNPNLLNQLCRSIAVRESAGAWHFETNDLYAGVAAALIAFKQEHP